MISNQIVRDLIEADLVVADLTDLNPNAFYELGIRHSAERPAIQIAKNGTDLPFDIHDLRTIFVDLANQNSIIAARVSLARAALEIKSQTYRVSNPITNANAAFEMRRSDDPRDRVLAELQDRLRSLEIGMRRMNLNVPSTANQSDLVNLLRWEASRMKYKGATIDEIERHLKGVAVGIGLDLQDLTANNDALELRTSLGQINVPY